MAAACGVITPVGDRPGDKRDCAGEQRVLLDCSSEVSYQGASGEASINVLDIAGAQGKFEEKAIRRVNTEVEQFVASQTRSCRDYNACVMSAEQYRTEAAETRRRLQILPALTEALKSSKSERERMRALDQLYRGVVPDEKRVEEVTFHLGMLVTMPASVGGGTFSVGPGGAVPTDAKVHFEVDVSRQAYVYIFQTTPKDEVNVLFPDPRIGTSNPLRASGSARIPARKAFRVNALDIGTENVYIVVSAKPVKDLDAALAKVKSGEVTTLAQERTLKHISLVKPPRQASSCKRRALMLDFSDSDEGGGGGCVRPRALQLDDDVDESLNGTAGDGGSGRRVEFGGVPAGLSVRTPPGDDLIVTVFPFEHLTLHQYKAAGGTSAPAHRTRGAVIEE